MIKNQIKYLIGSFNYLAWYILERPLIKLPRKTKKVLIINLAFIGDLLATTPLISILKKNGKSVSILIRKEMEPILDKNPYLEKILFWEKVENNFKLLNGYDVAILISPNSSDMIEKIKTAKIPLILRNTPHSFFSICKNSSSYLSPPYIEKDHKVIQNLMFLKYLNIRELNISPKNTKTFLRVDEKGISFTKKKFKLPKNFALISPGSRNQSFLNIRFPNPIKFAKSADYFIEKYGLEVVLIGAERDRETCLKILSNIKNKEKVLNLAGKTNIKELIQIVSLSKIVLAVDSGTVHIAAALNKNIIDIIRRKSSEIWYPWLPPNKFVLLVTRNRSLDSINLNSVLKSIDSFLASKSNSNL